MPAYKIHIFTFVVPAGPRLKEETVTASKKSDAEACARVRSLATHIYERGFETHATVLNSRGKGLMFFAVIGEKGYTHTEPY